MIAGVAGGLAEHLDADPSLIRIVWAVLIFLTGGLALLVYIVMAIVVPEGEPLDGLASSGASTTAADPNQGAVPGSADPAGTETARVASAGTAPASPGMAAPTATRRARRDPARQGQGGLIGGLILILLGAAFLVRQLVPAIDYGSWWPLILIGLGVILIVVAVMPGRRGG